MGKATRESSFGRRMGKVPNWECSFVSRRKGLFLFVYVEDIKNWLERNKSGSNVDSTHERR